MLVTASWAVLLVWVVQAGVGAVLLARWLADSRPAPRSVVAHVVLGCLALACWVVFLAAAVVPAARLAFAVLTVGLAIGDTVLVRRWRHASGSTAGSWAAYGQAVRAVVRGAVPVRVRVHALVSPAVWFTALGVCVVSS